MTLLTISHQRKFEQITDKNNLLDTYFHFFRFNLYCFFISADGIFFSTKRDKHNSGKRFFGSDMSGNIHDKSNNSSKSTNTKFDVNGSSVEKDSKHPSHMFQCPEIGCVL